MQGTARAQTLARSCSVQAVECDGGVVSHIGPACLADTCLPMR